MALVITLALVIVELLKKTQDSRLYGYPLSETECGDSCSVFRIWLTSSPEVYRGGGGSIPVALPGQKPEWSIKVPCSRVLLSSLRPLLFLKSPLIWGYMTPSTLNNEGSPSLAWYSWKNDMSRENFSFPCFAFSIFLVVQTLYRF